MKSSVYTGDNTEINMGTLFFWVCETDVPKACKMAAGIWGCCKCKDQSLYIFLILSHLKHARMTILMR